MAVVTSDHSARSERATPVPSWRESALAAARRLSAVAAAGALLGLLIGGVGGRLAMLVLAQLNPSATGITSDDGFTIGQFTVLGTLNLLVGGAVIGAIGAAVYVLVRPLIIGPPWFRALSISVGPAVVVGEQLVHVEGVDYHVLDPAWVAIAMFVLIPGAYAGLLWVLAERWLDPGHYFARGSTPVALAPLLTLAPVGPVLVVLALGWSALDLVRRRFRGAVPGAAAAAWVGRVALASVFAVALVRLLDETRALV